MEQKSESHCSQRHLGARCDLHGNILTREAAVTQAFSSGVRTTQRAIAYRKSPSSSRPGTIHPHPSSSLIFFKL